MSLINPHTLTEECRAARRRNARQSRGAATPEGKERSRAANLRHGIYSQQRDQALRALGEDPADLAARRAGAYEQWQPANTQQAHLVERLVHLEWCMDRAARRQENLEAQHLEKAAAHRKEKVDRLADHYRDMESFLNTLVSLGARPDFYVTPGFIDQFQRAFRDEMQWRLDKMLEFLHALRQPPNPLPTPQSLPEGAATDDAWEQFLALDEEDGITAVPRPDIPVAEDQEERDGLREDLRYLAKQELESGKTVWDRYIEKGMQPMTLAQRACAVMEMGSQLDRLRREEESCARLFWRTCNLLMKFQDRAEKQSEVRGTEFGVRSPGSGVQAQESGDREGQSEVRGPESEVQAQESGDREGQSEVQGPESDVQTPGSEPAEVPSHVQRPKSELTRNEVAPAEADNEFTPEVVRPGANLHENAGASGDVVEKTEKAAL